MIVLDASAALELLLGSPSGRAVARRLGDASGLHYPELMPIEVISAVRRLVASGRLSAHRAASVIDDLVDLGGQRHPHCLLLRDVFALSGRVTAYDAVYLALADLLDATLLTQDRRLARQAAGLVSIEVAG